eukprot:531716-Pelagomonas_calceolata.AAC.3
MRAGQIRTGDTDAHTPCRNSCVPHSTPMHGTCQSYLSKHILMLVSVCRRWISMQKMERHGSVVFIVFSPGKRGGEGDAGGLVFYSHLLPGLGMSGDVVRMRLVLLKLKLVTGQEGRGKLVLPEMYNKYSSMKRERSEWEGKGRKGRECKKEGRKGEGRDERDCTGRQAYINISAYEGS